MTYDMNRTRMARVSARSRKVIGGASAAAVARKILAADDLVIAMAGIQMLRPASRLLFFVAVNGPTSIKDAMYQSPLSYRAFYVTLDRLKAKGLLRVEIDPIDARMRRIVVGDAFTKLWSKL